MGKTTEKGDLGVAMVLADVMRRGYKVAMPLGDDWPFDIIVLRDKQLERVQVKYVESNGRVIIAKCRSRSRYVNYKYTKEHVDWIAVYDKTTDACYYVPVRLLGTGKTELSLRLRPPRNAQRKRIRYAKDFQKY